MRAACRCETPRACMIFARPAHTISERMKREEMDAVRRALPVPQRVMAVVLSALFVLCPLAAYAAGETDAAADPVLLPIDSKFPGDAYEHLLDAQESGDAEAVAAARKTLDMMVKREAKDICEKYLSVPATTNFGIMFVPFEGLYAEVVSRPGLIETLGRDYHVNVAGPSTMAAILNSLQMSYQTFRLQKRTDDVLRVLSAVKAELPRYQKALRRAQQQIETAGKTVEGIITTRTNVMERKLKDIDALEDADQVDEILGLTPAGLPTDQEDED